RARAPHGRPPRASALRCRAVTRVPRPRRRRAAAAEARRARVPRRAHDGRGRVGGALQARTRRAEPLLPLWRLRLGLARPHGADPARRRARGWADRRDRRSAHLPRRRRHAPRRRRGERRRRGLGRRGERPLHGRRAARRGRRPRAHVTRGGAAPMTPLYMLAFDHRSSFSRGLLGIVGTPDAAQAARVADVKSVVYEGFEAAISNGVRPETAGLLLDEQYGADIARRAHRAGVALAMPVEQSGRTEFDFEFGNDFGGHIDEFDPTFAKVLVRYNPEGDAVLNARQRIRLRRLSDWLHARDRKLLFELLVPAEPEQLADAGLSTERYDREQRPRLVVETIRELQARG